MGQIRCQLIIVADLQRNFAAVAVLDDALYHQAHRARKLGGRHTLNLAYAGRGDGGYPEAAC